MKFDEKVRTAEYLVHAAYFALSKGKIRYGKAKRRFKVSRARGRGCLDAAYCARALFMHLFLSKGLHLKCAHATGAVLRLFPALLDDLFKS